MKKKSVTAIIFVYVAIIVFTLAAVFIAGRSYTVYLHNPYDSDLITVEYSNEGIIKDTKIKHTHGYTNITFKCLTAGKTQVNITIKNNVPGHEGESTGLLYEFTVLPTGVIYVTGCDFGGYYFILLGIAFITVFSFYICFVQFKKRKKTQFFSYKTVLDCALIVFFGIQSLMYLGLFTCCVLYPHLFDGWRVYNLSGLIMMIIFALSIPFIVLFSVFISFSNVSLIRHEGLGKNNLFGFFISAVLFFGSVACVIATVRNPNSTVFEPSEIRTSIIRTVVSSAFVYFECLLLATQYCTQYCATHKPKYNQDFILILGCKIKKDGTPTPLLKGRIDRALEFYKSQLEKTGRQACFIPSGGKGSDEIISEAECMKNYLVEQGIDESIIFPETESTTTLENMRFSKRIADNHKKNANILFSTTNYHIFRSGINSAKAGFRADGIGAKTKWYFWPNAQMREFIGLLASEWKINAVFIVLTVVLSVLFGNIPAIINLVAG